MKPSKEKDRVSSRIVLLQAMLEMDDSLEVLYTNVFSCQDFRSSSESDSQLTWYQNTLLAVTCVLMRMGADLQHVPFIRYISLLIRHFLSKILQREILIGTVTKCVLLPLSFNKDTNSFRAAESHII